MKKEIEINVKKRLGFDVSSIEVNMRTTPHGYIEISVSIRPRDFPKVDLKWTELIKESAYSLGAIGTAVNHIAKNINEGYHRNLRVLKDRELPPRR